jgi:hypothetical protein
VDERCRARGTACLLLLKHRRSQVPAMRAAALRAACDSWNAPFHPSGGAESGGVGQGMAQQRGHNATAIGGCRV